MMLEEFMVRFGCTNATPTHIWSEKSNRNQDTTIMVYARLVDETGYDDGVK